MGRLGCIPILPVNVACDGNIGVTGLLGVNKALIIFQKSLKTRNYTKRLRCDQGGL